MKLFTIGFTHKTAEQFFTLLGDAGVKCLIDTRLHNVSQLAGFAKFPDLPFFLNAILKCEYRYMPELAPTDSILSDYRKDHDWERYVTRFEALMDERNIPHALDEPLFQSRACCLLCSEATPEQCHRRLVAERIARVWHDVEVIHLI